MGDGRKRLFQERIDHDVQKTIFYTFTLDLMPELSMLL
jgi:hypothetical protein